MVATGVLALQDKAAHALLCFYQGVLDRLEGQACILGLQHYAHWRRADGFWDIISWATLATCSARQTAVILVTDGLVFVMRLEIVC